MEPDDAAYQDQSHRRHQHKSVVHITVIIAPLRDDLEAQQLAAAQKLADKCHDDQNQRIAKAVANTVNTCIDRSEAVQVESD